MPKDPTVPTQQLVAIKEIRDGVVYLKRGGMRKILIVSGVNFDLKSEEEQNIILGGFQNFLNTLDFPVQFFVHSRKVDVSPYLAFLRGRAEEEENELLKIQIGEYGDFIRAFVDENAIIEKTFFAVVPYDSIVAPTGAVGGILALFKSRPRAGAETGGNEQEALSQLDRRVNQTIDGFSRIGLRAAPLENEALIELFYNLYNPELTEKQKVRG